MTDSINTILDSLRSHVLEKGNATAFTFLKSDDARDSVTFRQLDEKAKCIAQGRLTKAEPGDRAMMMFPPGLEFIEAFLGCLYAGIIAVPAYPPKKNRNAGRILSIARDCAPRLLLCTSETRRNIEGDFASAIPNSTTIATEDFVASRTQALPQLLPDQIAFLQYTSGSTAVPKGVCITHRNLIANNRRTLPHMSLWGWGRKVFWGFKPQKTLAV